MFRFHKPLDIITLFHKASSPVSVRAANILKKASAAASEASVADTQQSSSSAGPSVEREDFQLDITDELPTNDQLQTILEYTGKGKIGSVIKGATNLNEAFKKYRENVESFQRPVIVDWNQGHVVTGDNESEILKMLKSIQREET